MNRRPLRPESSVRPASPDVKCASAPGPGVFPAALLEHGDGRKAYLRRYLNHG